MGNQVKEDSKKHGIKLLTHVDTRWASFMGRNIYKACGEYINRPMQLLDHFKLAGAAAEAKGEFLAWEVPVTRFPVVQEYTEGIVKKVYIPYGPKVGEKKSNNHDASVLQLNIAFIEERIPSQGKQAAGAAPNIVHSLDAAHLMLISHRCDFPISTVHDSFGTLPCYMPQLYQIVRETFYELYVTDPLKEIAIQIKMDLSNFDFGTYDISGVLDAEFAFS
jgi:DNA-directed RNA polymerase, mitochondrial